MATTVLTYDRGGHSQSDAPPGRKGLEHDWPDLMGLITTLQLGPAHIVGKSSGGSIVLHTAAMPPAIFQSLTVHEPLLVDLLVDDPAFAEVLQRKEAIAPVVGLIEEGEHHEAAKLFMETVAFGPTSWDHASERVRKTWVQNALTFLDEAQDPLVQSLDVNGVAGFPHPVLLTYDDESQPYLPAVVTKLAGAMPQARTHRSSGIVGGGRPPGEIDPSVTSSRGARIASPPKVGWVYDAGRSLLATVPLSI